MCPNPDGGSGGDDRETEAEYFARRAEEQLRLAAAARDEPIARIHHLLAEKYLALAARERRRSTEAPESGARSGADPPQAASTAKNMLGDGTSAGPES
jgi:hypothetical protein